MTKENQHINCIMCERQATVFITPMIKILPDDPEGWIDWKLFGMKMPFCDKHRLEYQITYVDGREYL